MRVPSARPGCEVRSSSRGSESLVISFLGAFTGDTLVGDVTMQRSLNTISAFGATSVISASSPTNLVLRSP